MNNSSRWVKRLAFLFLLLFLMLITPLAMALDVFAQPRDTHATDTSLSKPIDSRYRSPDSEGLKFRVSLPETRHYQNSIGSEIILIDRFELLPPDGTCRLPFVLEPMDTVSGDTTGFPSEQMAFSGSCQTGNSGENVFAFEPESSGALSITLETSDADLGFYLRRADCVNQTFLCIDREVAGVDETFTVPVSTTETYYLIVDGHEEGVEGPFSLNTSAVIGESSCSDGLDNNGDLLTDCEDASCWSESACTAAIADACGAATPITPGVPQSGDTTSGFIEFSSWNPVCTDVEQASANLYGYQPSQDELLILTLDSTTDHGLYVRTGCSDPTTQIACVDFVLGDNDERLDLRATGGQMYTIFVSSFTGDQDGVFTLESSAFQYGESEPNDTPQTADPASGGEIGDISIAGDQDWYLVTLSQSGDLSISTADVLPGDCADGLIDSEIELLDTDGITGLAENDDFDAGAGNFCSTISVVGLSAGTYFLRVGSSAAFCPGCVFPYALDIDISAL